MVLIQYSYDVRIVNAGHRNILLNMIRGEKSKKLPLYIYTIDLFMDESLSYEDFIKNVKEQVKNIISDLLQKVDIPELGHVGTMSNTKDVCANNNIILLSKDDVKL